MFRVFVLSLVVESIEPVVLARGGGLGGGVGDCGSDVEDGGIGCCQR